MQRYNQRLIEELKNRQTQERARLPKIQRSEAKTRMAMFKKSLRINSTATPDQDREKIKQFAAQEEKRQKNERMAQHQKHESQMRDLQLQCEANVRELHQLQNEKCHLLVEHETQKLKELDEEHSQELKEWREKLRPRKKVTSKVVLNTAVWSMHYPSITGSLYQVQWQGWIQRRKDSITVPKVQALMSNECKLGSLLRGGLKRCRGAELVSTGWVLTFVRRLKR